MQLRRLELHGFKTFANATTFDFASGITAVVGPNGAGKSNVADAIIWALGEHNIRTLRGGKLSDVIFAGSSNRRPIGLAEVSLTFDNTSRTLPLDFAEVTVTRRVYRSDESEYFINRTACRLRDIVDLFLDTGIGRESYFALNQGEIDMILSANPEERRVLFEEAAGVKKYRARKRESLRKLEQTQQNLSRIHDLMAEVEARIGPLERQAAAAARYQELGARLRAAELGSFAADWMDLQQRHNANAGALQGARVEVMAVEVKLAALGADEESARLRVHAADEALEIAHRSFEELNHQRSGLESRLHVLEERLRSDSAAAERAAARHSELIEQRNSAAGDLAEHEQQLFEVEKSVRSVEGELAAARRAVGSAEDRLKIANQALDAAQSRAVQSAAHGARLQADREAAARRLRGLNDQIARIEERIRETDERRKSFAERSQQITAAQQSVAIRRETVRTNIETIYRKLSEIQAQAAGLAEQIRSREGDLAGARSRLRLLEELQESREGFYKGVKAVLQANASAKLKGHYRAVADLITVDPAHEAAIEAALGGSVQDIVTTTDAEAREGILFLKRLGAGRATFLSLDLVSRLARRGSRPDVNAPGVIGTALELVRYEALYQPIMEMLIGRTVVCDILENGNDAARKLSNWNRIVTLDGEVISSQGAMTGGSRQQGRTSVVGRSSQIQELRQLVSSIQRELDTLRASQGDHQARLDNTRKSRAEAETLLQGCQTEEASLNRDREHLTTDSARLQREEASLSTEMERARMGERNELAAIERLAAKEGEGAAADSSTSAPDTLRAAAADAAAHRDAVREDLSSLQVREASVRERRRALSAVVDDLRKRLDRLSAEERSLLGEMSGDGADADQIRRELETLREQMPGLDAALEGRQHSIEVARSDRETAMASRDAISSATRLALHASQEQTRVLYRLEADHAAIRAEMDRIVSVLAEDYGVGASSDRAGGETARPGAPEEAADLPDAGQEDGSSQGSETQEAGPVVSDEVITAFLQGVPASQQPTQDRQLAARLRRQMRSMEPVNLNAIEESRAVAERFEFLKTQRADIEAAALDLQSVITRIDQDARERFMTTFGAIAEQFDDLFRKLFGGGQTKLVLTDPSQPTESGIEISAQPPGKRLQNLPLLSGGERSLTAVALLFAMLRVRPVPFCIMDEVDAALDEANIARFGEMVKEFAANTQFIIITHNRGTMEVADRLYGITMSEPGVSRTLAVQLADIEPSTPNNGHNPLLK